MYLCQNLKIASVQTFQLGFVLFVLFSITFFLYGYICWVISDLSLGIGRCSWPECFAIFVVLSQKRCSMRCYNAFSSQTTRDIRKFFPRQLTHDCTCRCRPSTSSSILLFGWKAIGSVNLGCLEAWTLYRCKSSSLKVGWDLVVLVELGWIDWTSIYSFLLFTFFSSFLHFLLFLFFFPVRCPFEIKNPLLEHKILAALAWKRKKEGDCEGGEEEQQK